MVFRDVVTMVEVALEHLSTFPLEGGYQHSTFLMFICAIILKAICHLTDMDGRRKGTTYMNFKANTYTSIRGCLPILLVNASTETSHTYEFWRIK